MTRVVGLDIGDGVLRAAEVKDPARARPTVVKYHEVPIPHGAVSKGEVIDRDMVVAGIKALWSQGKFGTKDVVLGMGNHRILARDHVVRAQPIDRIREQLPFQVQDLLPVPVNDALLDFYPVSTEQTDQGPMVHGLLVAAIRDAVLGNVEAAEAAGLHVAEVDLIPFALTRLLLGAQSGMTALVDIGASTTYVVMAANGVPHFMRVIPTGGRDITDAVVASHDIPFGEAERIKRTIGILGRPLSPEAQPIAATIAAATHEQLMSVRNTISYFATARPNTPVQRVVLSGGGGDLPGIREAFAELTRLPVTDADPGSRVTVAKSARVDGVGWRDSLSVAVGLAVGEHGMTLDLATRAPEQTPDDGRRSRRGLKSGPQISLGRPRSGAQLVVGGQPRANLLPPEIILKRKQLKTRRALRFGVVLVAIGTAAACALTFGVASVAQVQYSLAQQTQSELIAEQAQYGEVRDVQNTIATLTAGRQVGASTEINWEDYLVRLQATLPAGVVLKSVAIDSATPMVAFPQSDGPLQGARVASLTFSAQSSTLPSIPDWLRSMADLPGFVDATPGSVSSEGSVYTAIVLMHINADAFSLRFDPDHMAAEAAAAAEAALHEGAQLKSLVAPVEVTPTDGTDGAADESGTDGEGD